MKKSNNRTIAIRIIAILLTIFSFLFGCTWKNGFCFGDHVLTRLGLPIWSKGTQGTHYSGMLALIMFLIAIYIFSLTIRKKDKAFRK